MSDFVKRIDSPDAAVVRMRELARAKAGKVVNTGCPHPVSAIEQFVDDAGYVGRNDKPVNLFMCTICSSLLRLVDYNNTEAQDG